MAEKKSTIVLQVDLECERCNKKIRKVLSKLQDRENIDSIEYDEKNNKITIIGPFDPERLIRKLCCKACKVIKDIQIVEDKPCEPAPEPPPPPPPPPAPEPEPTPPPAPEPPPPEPEPAPPAPEPPPPAPEPAPPAPEPPPPAPEPPPPAPEPPPPAPEPEPPKPEPPPPKPEPNLPKLDHPHLWLVCCCHPCPCYHGYPYHGCRCCSCGKDYGWGPPPAYSDCQPSPPPQPPPPVVYGGPQPFYGGPGCKIIFEEDPAYTCTVM